MTKLLKKSKLSSLYKDKDWPKFKNKPTFPLGYKIASPIDNLVVVLGRLPFNFLIGGKDKSEKNNFFHCAIITLLKTPKKENLKFILIGNKKSELAFYKKLPNLCFPVISDFEYAKEAVQWCLSEIDRRLLISYDCDGIFDEYNKTLKEKIPRIVVIIENLDELMKSNGKFYKQAFDKINMLSTLVNIHFIVGISKPSNTKLIPNKVTRGFFYRATFAMADPIDLKMLIGNSEPMKLKGKNELFYNFGNAKEKPEYLKGFLASKKYIKTEVN